MKSSRPVHATGESAAKRVVIDWIIRGGGLSAVRTASEVSMEVRLSIDETFLKQLQEKIGDRARETDLVREAFTLLNWAVDEAAAGRVILSTNETGGEVHRLVMPSLTHVETKYRQRRPAEAEQP